VSITPSKSPHTYFPRYDYTFPLQGARGQAYAFMRLVQVEKLKKNVHPFKQSVEKLWEVEKLRIEMNGLEGYDVISVDKDLTSPRFIDTGAITTQN